MTTPQTSATASTSSSSTQNIYYDFNIPLGLKDLILDVIEGSQSDPNIPQIPTPTISQMWFSQPRSGNDPTTEVLTVNFKEPVTVSELTWDVLRVGMTVTLWYQDRQNNWRPVLDTSRNPISLTLSSSTTTAWYTANYTCYQFIATALQWRFTRIYSITVGTQPYPVGMRNGLIQRNIYNRSSGTQGIDTQQDIMGNTIEAYIQDWDASQAIDDNPNTFWRSAPQPDPSAVVSLYLDCRAPNGDSQLIDTVYIDPVYTGQALNLYYSNDDTQGTLTLSPVTALPTVNENTNWVEGTGLIDISTVDPQTSSNYQFPMQWGPLVSQDTWFGIEWTPNFAAGLTNTIQDVSVNGAPTGGTFTLKLDTQTTVAIAYNASATTVQSALAALSNVGVGNVTVTGPAGSPYVVTFTGTLAGTAVDQLVPNAAGLTGGFGVSVGVTTITVGGQGDGPPTNPVLLQSNPLVMEGVDAEQVIALLGSPTNGSFTLTYDGQTTSALAYDCTPAQIEAALIALSNIGPNDVSVVGANGDDNPPWYVTFTGDLAAQPIATMTTTSSLTGTGTVGVTVATSTPGQEAVVANIVGQYSPTFYYDVGAGQFVLELTDGTTTLTYNCPITSLFGQYAPLRIVVGWGYSPPTVFISIVRADGTVVGTLTNTAPELPSLITLDGQVGFQDFAGTFTAHVIKLENWSVGQVSFQANPTIYVDPDPVQPDVNGNIPATTLNNAIYASAWTVQDNGTGGSHESAFAYKTWTPILANYFTTKGNLFLPQQISLKYLKLEMTNLTEEYYPVYDSNIPVTYNVFPPSVTNNTSLNTANSSQTSDAAGLLTTGSDVVLSGVGSVNWLNPSTVNAAVNSVYGQTVTPVTVTNTPGYNSLVTLPNTTALDLANQTRQEISSPWVYTRSPLTATTMAGQTISTVASSVSSQGLTTSTAPIASQVASSFNPTVTSNAARTSLPTQGTDWWVFPGATLRLPANVMTGLTQSTSTVTSAKPSTETRLRFTTPSVHYYTQKSAVRDATVAYYAGIREVQPYVTTYIAGQDPPVFSFTRYDPSQWVLTNCTVLPSGPITTAGVLYELINGNFDTDINNWTATGNWSYNGSTGHWDYGAAQVVANGTLQTLVSLPLDVSPGAEIESSVWVTWEGLTATSGSEALQLQAWFYNNGTYVSQQAVGLSYTPWASSTPEMAGNIWAQIVAAQEDATNFSVPDGVNQMSLVLVVTAAATAGTINFDTVLVGTTDTTEGTAYKEFFTTATFDRLQCVFQDSGLVRSDDMWAQEDPLDTNISSTALAYYTTTIPDKIPAGMWADTFADWDDPTITWGEPFPEVAINVDPNRVYNNKRVLHFTRVAGAGSAGIAVRQITNFVANGLFRLGCIFLKPNNNANQITLQLVRVSDGVVVYTEVFTPIVGYWYTHVTNFIEIPDSEDQEYTLEFLLTGDAADEVYLNDLYSEVALIRYFAQLGGADQFNHDVTALAYADTAIVSCTTPVQEFSIEVAILSPDAYAYGGQLTPNYLQ